ncbi:sel1 repeat family protein [Luteimonas huabeiensis]|uniref:sel1 repeat family protein n=1 Tax=Luteimonas huabeiensis TaxID=1244513 RepID=UPI0005BBE40F|nr:sel1 repeat family protein [Luteimonas huabeiensis]
MRTLSRLGALLLALAGGQAVAAGPGPAEGADARFVDRQALDGADPEILRSAGFEAAHPDLQFRRLGAEALQAGRLEDARGYFRRAARFGDKLSQAAYAEMLWEGQGGPADRPLGYAWMDLAAERGAPLALAHRERYWHRLDEAERTRALEVGQAVYAEYGDAIALPRLERTMRRVANNVTGSRTGWVGRVDVSLGMDPGGRTGAPKRGESYYADRYWKIDEYVRWQNEALRTPVPEGRVDVGAPESLPDGD